MSWSELTAMVQPGQLIQIMTHEKPDGDAWGSVLGLGIVLEHLGYTPQFVLSHLTVTKLFTWLPGQHLLKPIDPDTYHVPEDAVLLVLDCGDLSRCEFHLKPEQIHLNIDHHVSNPSYGRANWLDFDAGATAQIICRTLLGEQIPIPKEAATCFYMALASDTGGFRFSNTGGETLRIAAEMIDLGADLEQIRHYLWENRPRQELDLLQEMMKSMLLFAHGHCVLCSLSHDTIASANLLEAETDAALEIIRSIEGVEAVVLLKEVERGQIRVSLRSKRYLDCAQFMSQLGGGGHLRAAGATLEGSLDDAREMLVHLLTEADVSGQ